MLWQELAKQACTGPLVPNFQITLNRICKSKSETMQIRLSNCDKTSSESLYVTTEKHVSQIFHNFKMQLPTNCLKTFDMITTQHHGKRVLHVSVQNISFWEKWMDVHTYRHSFTARRRHMNKATTLASYAQCNKLELQAVLTLGKQQ